MRRFVTQQQFTALINSQFLFNKEDYSKQTTLTGTKLHYNTPVLGSKEEDKELKRPRNQLQKSCHRQYQRDITNVFKNVTGKKRGWSVWISKHLYVDFNLTLDKEDIQVGTIQGFFIGEGMPPCVVTLYDSKDNMSGHEKMQEFTGTLAQELDSALHNFCFVDFVILPITISWDQWTKDTLEREIQNQQDHMEEFFFKGPLEFTKSDFQKVEAAANALTGVSYVPYILSKYQEQEDAEFSEQDYLILMERQWRHSLSLMIEALSFEDGDCSITYTEENENKAKMAAIEAARRWSLTTNVIFDSHAKQNDLSSAVETNLQTEMHLTMHTPMEPRDESAKFIFLDCDDVTVPRVAKWGEKAQD
ncbi:uncharacterized protein [Littorina saxatilis]|uniref:uncharacterized protein isoform X2 n=1 Tax=Littorina saxatilis TaxID=31220 RepID=UPI0038B5E0BA